MKMSCELGVIEITDVEQEVHLSGLGAGIHKDHNNGFFPAHVVTNDEAAKKVVHSLILSCMFQHSESKTFTPWEIVENRLKTYQISHKAFIRTDPDSRIDIEIFSYLH